MQTETVHFPDKHPYSIPFRIVVIEGFTLLLIIATFLPACFLKKTAPLDEKGKSYISGKAETTDNPLLSLLTHLRLTDSDLKVELFKRDPDHFRLEKVNLLLNNPLKIEPYADYISKSIRDNQVSLEKVISLAVKELEIAVDSKAIQHTSSHHEDYQLKNLFPKISSDARDELLKFLSIIYPAQKRCNEAFSPLSYSEIQFLESYFSEMILNDKIVLEEDTQVSPQSSSRRKTQYVKETSFYLAGKIKQNDLYEASLMVAGALDALLKNTDLLKNISITDTPKKDIELNGDIILCKDTPSGKIIIGGKGPTSYRNTNALLIIDLGGDDEYHNIFSSFNCNPFNSPLSIIIDLEGNDLYLSNEKYTLGGGSFGLSFLVDCSGNDRYISQDFSLGCGFFGVGLLYDKEGNDYYISDIMGQGAAAFGVGILCDLEGNDSYHGNLFNQGMGFVGGIGLLIEAQGNDNFFSGGKYPDFREPEVAFDSFSQGFGFGFRNFGSGGIGILWDDGGNDHYSSSYFSQGSSYWFALGLLIDNAGSDNYHARRYTQGAGTHLTVGALVDRSGDDYYTALGVAQGCGYDLSQGLLIDSNGDDTYNAKWFAQGVSGASGVGMLIDQKGNDSYLCGTFNSQGSGQYDAKREAGSIGLLIDLTGEDSYVGKGKDNCLWRQGKYGGGIDCSTSFWNTNTPSWTDDEIILKEETVFSSTKPPVFEKKELLPELETSLENEDSRKLLVSKLSEKGPSIIPQLIAYLDMKDEQLKLTIMEIVKKMGKDAGATLRKALFDNNYDNSLKYYIIYMLGDIADENYQDTLAHFLNSDDRKLRALAMRGLSKLETAIPLVKILPYTEDESSAVRKYLATVLKSYEEPEALKALTGLLSDSHFTVRFAAFETLRGKGEAVEPYLHDLVEHRNRYPEYAVKLVKDLLKEWKVNYHP